MKKQVKLNSIKKFKDLTKDEERKIAGGGGIPGDALIELWNKVFKK